MKVPLRAVLFGPQPPFGRFRRPPPSAKPQYLPFPPFFFSPPFSNAVVFDHSIPVPPIHRPLSNHFHFNPDGRSFFDFSSFSSSPSRFALRPATVSPGDFTQCVSPFSSSDPCTFRFSRTHFLPCSFFSFLSSKLTPIFQIRRFSPLLPPFSPVIQEVFIYLSAI